MAPLPFEFKATFVGLWGGTSRRDRSFARKRPGRGERVTGNARINSEINRPATGGEIGSELNATEMRAGVIVGFQRRCSRVCFRRRAVFSKLFGPPIESNWRNDLRKIETSPTGRADGCRNAITIQSNGNFGRSCTKTVFLTTHGLSDLPARAAAMGVQQVTLIIRPRPFTNDNAFEPCTLF